jgi:acetyl/propionyl-CoA carboxylase alpha subunit
VKVNFEHDGQSFSVDLTPAGKSYRVEAGAETVEVQILHTKDGKLDLLIDGKRVTVYVSSDHNRRWVTVNGRTLVFNKSTGGHRSGGGHHHTAGELTAPMPGKVRAVNVKEGEAVTKGQTLLLLEAMKMEIRVQAPRNGVVRKLSVQQGQMVEREQMLIEIADTLEG